MQWSPCSTMTLRWLIFYYLSKGNKGRKQITDIAWENKERKNRNKNENPIILALLIGQEAVLSL